jgi:aspartate aminotransferase
MNAPIISNRAYITPPSPIRRLAHLATAAKKTGLHVYHLNIGQPDIESPAEFFEGLKNYNKKVVAYENSQGLEALRISWSNYINKTLNLDTKAEEFLITTGASEALIFSFTVCCDPGDEIIIFDPTYANYIGFACVDGVKLVPVACWLDKNFALPTAETIVKKITNRTKAILLCNPNNPTGTVYSEKELRMLLDLCDKYNLFLIVDETYREFVYDNQKALSVLHLTKDNPRVIVIDSLSKRFSLCGARLGCLITSNKQVLATTLNMAQARLASPTIEQIASSYMLDNIADKYLSDVITEYAKRRDVLYDNLQKIPDVEAHKPGGAFYMVVKLPVDDAEKFASFLLKDFSYNKATVFLAPAVGFYMDHENGRGLAQVRVAYVLKEDDIVKAVEIIKQGLKSYK